MRQLILMLFLMFSSSTFAEDSNKCSLKGANLIGLYGEKGEFKSPFLKMWSEESGNLFTLLVESKESYSKVGIILKNEQSKVIDSIDFKLVKNKTNKIDLVHIVTELKERPRFLEIKVFNKDASFFCSEEQVIIEKDDQDGVMKNVK